MSCLVILMAQYILAEGPLIFFNAIPRNMGFFLCCKHKCAQTDCDEVHSKHKKVVYYIAHSMSFYSTFSVDRSTNIYCTLNARFVLHSVDGPLII